MEQTVKRKIGVRDIMTIAAMMVINFAIAMVIGRLHCLSQQYIYTALLVLMPLLEQHFIWLRQIALTNTDCCLLGLRFMD